MERAGTLSVEGDAEAPGPPAGAALEVASAPWAADTPVRLVGGDVRLACLEQVEMVDHAQALANAAWAGLDLDRAPSTLAGLVGADESFAARGGDRRPRHSHDEVLGQISAKAKAGSAGLVLVAPGPIAGATWRLVIGADRAGVLEPLGIALRCAVDAETVDNVVGLLAGHRLNLVGERGHRNTVANAAPGI